MSNEAPYCEVLRAFVAGEASFQDVEAALTGVASFTYTTGVFSVRTPHGLDCRIELQPKYLRPMLERYLAFQADEEAVSVWATVIRLLDCFSNPPALDSLPDAEADSIRDPLWDLLSDLSSPGVFGRITRPGVEEALEELAQQQKRYDRVLGLAPT